MTTFSPPPESVQGIPGPTYVAHDGCVWRRSMQGWDIVDDYTAPRLLAGFRADAKNTEDWWHRRAAELAAELSTAIETVISEHMEHAA